MCCYMMLFFCAGRLARVVEGAMPRPAGVGLLCRPYFKENSCVFRYVDKSLLALIVAPLLCTVARNTRSITYSENALWPKCRAFVSSRQQLRHIHYGIRSVWCNADFHIKLYCSQHCHNNNTIWWYLLELPENML